MQDDALKCPAEDDMTDGDLGDGNRGRPGHQARSRSQGDLEELSLATRFQKRRSDGCGESFSWTRYGQDTRGKHPCASCDGSDVECHSDHTSEELQRRLQEATLEVEVLRTELEVTHRHLEGKHEAVRILQGHAILEKATNHSKLLLQKTEERNKALEKEVNGLQWEINFNQVQFKNVEQAWVEKYERVCSENRALSKSLDEKSKEVQALRTENSSLSQQCVELLALLSAKERSAFQGTLPPANKGREGSVLELAVLGACQCSSGQNDPCPCAQSAAGSRKQVLQLKQELDAQRRKKEEAFVMADAFRIAFEQQLRRGSEHVLRMAETDRHKPSKQRQGQCRQGSLSLAQRLKGILPSTLEGKIPDDPTEMLHLLLDLMSDKEEALAHQRKVSYMLARNAEELERRLHVQMRETDCADTKANTLAQTLAKTVVCSCDGPVSFCSIKCTSCTSNISCNQPEDEACI